MLNSFTTETLVHTADGLKAIQDVELGESVLSFAEWNGENSYEIVEEIITGEKEYLFVQLTLENGEHIDATDGHPFYETDKGWVSAKQLEVGDNIQLADKATVEIASIAYDLRKEKVFNLSVAKNNTFYIGQEALLVHNCKEVTKRTEGRGSPALKGDPYSPSEVSKRQSQRRRDAGVNADPDTPLPDRGPGGNIKEGVHTSEGKVRHNTGERNVASKEEHSIKQKGNGRGIH